VIVGGVEAVIVSGVAVAVTTAAETVRETQPCVALRCGVVQYIVVSYSALRDSAWLPFCARYRCITVGSISSDAKRRKVEEDGQVRGAVHVVPYLRTVLRSTTACGAVQCNCTVQSVTVLYVVPLHGTVRLYPVRVWSVVACKGL
jgi:hypothetical protein